MRELHNFERDLVGGDKCRLDIPLTSVNNLKQTAEILRGLATRLEYLYHFPPDRPTLTMLSVRMLVRSANADLTKIRRRGRPKKQKPWRAPYKI